MKNFNFLNVKSANVLFRTTKGFFLLLVGLSFLSLTARSQRIVKIPSGTELSQVIRGDTTDTGNRVDVNTIYELERNGFYPVAKELNLKTTLHIRGAEGDGALPAIYAQKNSSNKYPKVINTHGDVILENVYLSNANGPDANPKWGGFRVAGTNSRVILNNCQLEYDKASTVQIRADSIKLYMNNCIAAKTGNYAAYNGNGRLVDTRGYYVDSIVVKNVTVYYMQDRVIRNMGGEINYLEFNHVTVVNNQGMHGCFAMAKVHHAKIVNNLIINGEYGGDRLNDPEQTGPEPDKKHIYMITMDTIYDGMTLEIHNNNFAFTQDLIDFFNSIDSIWKPMVMAPLVKKELVAEGADTNKAYFEEPVKFNKMPGIPWDFLKAIYTNPQPSPMPNNWPDTIGVTNIDAGYAKTYQSYSAAEDGKPLGDLSWFKEFTGIKKHDVNIGNVMVYPNPVRDLAVFRFELKSSSSVQLSVYSLTGQRMVWQDTGNQFAGNHTLKVDLSGLVPGVYLYSIKTDRGIKGGKIIIQH